MILLDERTGKGCLVNDYLPSGDLPCSLKLWIFRGYCVMYVRRYYSVGLYLSICIFHALSETPMLSNSKKCSSRFCLWWTPGINLPVDDPYDYTNGRQDRSDEGKRLRPEKRVSRSRFPPHPQKNKLRDKKDSQNSRINFIRHLIHHSRRDKHPKPRILIQHIKKILAFRNDFFVCRMHAQFPLECKLLHVLDVVGAAEGRVFLEESRIGGGVLRGECPRKEAGEVGYVDETGG